MLSAPFQIDELKKIVSGEIVSPQIDLVSSKIKNQSLLTYIYNLNLVDASVDSQSASFQERRDLFLAFLNHKTTVSITGFSEAYLKCLLKLKQINDLDEEAIESLSTAVFSDDEVDTLMSSDAEVIDAIEHSAFLLDGIIVHLMLNINNIDLQLDGDFGKIGIVNDPTWIGHTWVNLLGHPVFNAYYYSKMPELQQLLYFPYQYSEPVYRGKCLFDYLGESAVVASLLEMAVDGIKEQQS